MLELKLQPEESFVLKVVQLEELLQVRHSVFVIGNTGCGKSQVVAKPSPRGCSGSLRPLAVPSGRDGSTASIPGHTGPSSTTMPGSARGAEQVWDRLSLQQPAELRDCPGQPGPERGCSSKQAGHTLKMPSVLQCRQDGRDGAG